MPFVLTEEQQMLRDSVSAFLTRSYDFDQRNAIVRAFECRAERGKSGPDGSGI